MFFNSGAMPGQQAKVESAEVQIAWGHENLRVFDTLGIIASASTDAGNSPTTTLRGGLVMAKNSSDLWVPYDSDAGDITGVARGILLRSRDMLNAVTHVAENKGDNLILVAGLVKAAQCINLDVRARVALRDIIFDDQLQYNGAPAGFLGQARQVITKAADYTVVAADSGSLFVATAAVNFTLPTKAHGLAFEFVQTADANMGILSGGSADDIIVDGDTGADSVTFSTSSHKVGSRLRVECVYTAASTLKWIVANLGGTTMTIA